MKRPIVVLGRFGTVLIIIGLAMIIISLIPAAQTHNFSGIKDIKPKRFSSWPSSPLNMPYSLVLTPQQSLHVAVKVNTTITVYLLDVNATYLTEQTGDDSSKLVQFLETHDIVLWQKEVVNREIELKEYVPPKVVNALLVFSNLGSETAYIEYEGSISSLIAPTKRVQTPAIWLISIGIVLAIPWLVLTKVKKV